MMSRPRLLLADDHPDTAELLRSLLQPEFDVIAHVQDGRALVCAAERLSPDVIVSDITMPGLDGIAAAAAILVKDPAARIILVTVHGDPVPGRARPGRRGARICAESLRRARTWSPPFTPRCAANVTSASRCSFRMEPRIRPERPATALSEPDFTRGIYVSRQHIGVTELPGSRSRTARAARRHAVAAADARAARGHGRGDCRGPCRDRGGDPRRWLPAPRVRRVGLGDAGALPHRHRERA